VVALARVFWLLFARPPITKRRKSELIHYYLKLTLYRFQLIIIGFWWARSAQKVTP